MAIDQIAGVQALIEMGDRSPQTYSNSCCELPAAIPIAKPDKPPNPPQAL